MATRKTTSKSTTRSAAGSARTASAKPRRTVKVTPKKAAIAPETASQEAAMPESVDAQTPSVEASVSEEQLTGPLRKRGMVNAVAERSGVKRKDAKAAVEAALALLGEAIADGRGLNLPGMGKLKVMRTKKQGNAHVYVTRIRQPEADAGPDPETGSDQGGKDPLAEAAE